MLVITQLQPISVLFSVAEDYLPQIRQQLRRGSHLPVDAFDRTQQNKLSSGTLLTFDSQIDPTTGTIRLKANVPNVDSALFPNQFVNARLLVDTQHNVVLVPNAAIQRNAQQAFVYLVKPIRQSRCRTSRPARPTATSRRSKAWCGVADSVARVGPAEHGGVVGATGVVVGD